ncbi:MAG: hypothetical protein J0H68_08735 [Sphingobacteriia bacterium]|nr:hypothetical protein [Sphingobacteriia bacterium]
MVTTLNNELNSKIQKKAEDLVQNKLKRLGGSIVRNVATIDVIINHLSEDLHSAFSKQGLKNTDSKEIIENNLKKALIKMHGFDEQSYYELKQKQDDYKNLPRYEIFKQNLFSSRGEFLEYDSQNTKTFLKEVTKVLEASEEEPYNIDVKNVGKLGIEDVVGRDQIFVQYKEYFKNLKAPLQESDREILEIAELYFDARESDLKAQLKVARSNSMADPLIQKIFDIKELAELADNKLNELNSEIKLSNERGKGELLSPKEKEFIKCLHHLNKGRYLTSSEKELVGEMLNKIAGDKDFNNRLSKVLKEKDNYFVTKYKGGIDKARSFSFKVQKIEKYEAIANKIKNNEKLTITDLGYIDRLDDMSELINEFKDRDVPINNKYMDMIINFKETIAQVNQEYTKSLNTGDVTLTKISKAEEFRDKKFKPGIPGSSYEAEIGLTKKFVSKYKHAANIVKKDDNLKVSEIYSEYAKTQASMKDLVESDVYRVDVTSLISPQIKNQLQKEGLNIKELNDVFQYNQNEMHKQLKSNFSEVENSNKMRFMAGIKDLGVVKAFRKLNPYKHKRNDAAIHEQYFSDISTKDKKFCSQMVAEGIIATVVQMNKQIEARYGVKDAIKIPFEKTVNTKNIHPEKLQKLLDKAGCLKKVSLSEGLRNLVDLGYDSLDINKLSQSKRQEVFLKAVRQEDHDILNKFFDPKNVANFNKKGFISPKIMDKAINMAIENDNLDLLTKLMNAEPKLSEKTATKLLQYSLEKFSNNDLDPLTAAENIAKISKIQRLAIESLDKDIEKGKAKKITSNLVKTSQKVDEKKFEGILEDLKSGLSEKSREKLVKSIDKLKVDKKKTTSKNSTVSKDKMKEILENSKAKR